MDKNYRPRKPRSVFNLLSSENSVYAFEVVTVDVVECLLRRPEAPVLVGNTGDVHSGVCTVAENVLNGNNCSICRGLPHRFDDASASRSIFSALSPIVALESAIVKRKAALIVRCLPQPAEKGVVIVGADVGKAVFRIVVRKMGAVAVSLVGKCKLYNP